MRKWAWSVVSIGLIMVLTLAGCASGEDKREQHKNMDHENMNHGEMKHGEDGHQGHEKGGKGSEVTPSVSLKTQKSKQELIVSLKDHEGNPVNQKDLVKNHERLIHLIVVSRDQEVYQHLHPKPEGKGTFTVTTELPSGSYQAFVDIKPKSLSYEVSPVPLQVGDKKEPPAQLKPNKKFTQSVHGTTVTMKPTTFKANQPTMLDFRLKGGEPQQYLGALGHVVILDEKAEDFVHVHPASDKETRFATEFKKPGIYKIWAEFKVNGKVNVFPFVVNVQ
ncbi:hypothetical protein GCM10011571_27050 [Marinithermofilum abyssi]|uniref:YtkA-like domain-containing protein n=1 Tax=Marinithermofilum abyssi TaxID=1571185 RepID=A0A8J2VIH8_9BACL|nr:hypothetical protein [Marinithermofilum abyssi]GGE23541.1 hypothetical protein GCM10011571_27050 [Marinithermofilum abyssi]